MSDATWPIGNIQRFPSTASILFTSSPAWPTPIRRWGSEGCQARTPIQTCDDMRSSVHWPARLMTTWVLGVFPGHKWGPFARSSTGGGRDLRFDIPNDTVSTTPNKRARTPPVHRTETNRNNAAIIPPPHLARRRRARNTSRGAPPPAAAPHRCFPCSKLPLPARGDREIWIAIPSAPLLPARHCTADIFHGQEPPLLGAEQDLGI